MGNEVTSRRQLGHIHGRLPLQQNVRSGRHHGLLPQTTGLERIAATANTNLALRTRTGQRSQSGPIARIIEPSLLQLLRSQSGTQRRRLARASPLHFDSGLKHFDAIAE